MYKKIKLLYKYIYIYIYYIIQVSYYLFGKKSEYYEILIVYIIFTLFFHPYTHITS